MGCTGSKNEPAKQEEKKACTDISDYLDAGGAEEYLAPKEFIVSENGKFTLILQEDGNLVLYRGHKALWSTQTEGKTVTKALLTENGVFQLLNGTEVVWEVKDAEGKNADHIVVQGDGNLVIYDKDNKSLWTSDTVTEDDGAYDLRTRGAVVAGRVPIATKVEAGKTYYWCTCGLSKNQPFCDGSHSGTEFAPMVWTAPKDETKYFCSCKETKNAPFCDGAHRVYDYIEDYVPLLVGQTLWSQNKDFSLTLQDDGNLVLYKKDGEAQTATWSSKTVGSTVTRAIVSTEGAFVVLNGSETVWNSGATGTKVILQDDGNLVFYNSDNEPVWASADHKEAASS